MRRALSDGVEALANGGILAWRSILVFKRPSLSLRVRAEGGGARGGAVRAAARAT